MKTPGALQSPLLAGAALPKSETVRRPGGAPPSRSAQRRKLAVFLAAALLLIVLPFVLQIAGNAWVRIVDVALLYVLLALGLNIVVGYAGLLDLGYVAFYAV
ncbi:MAG: hypothetical protein M3Z16_01705, partial [Pseudomonadota bacterium]|nr:hypothetical protein [Pseudomonadota bacterium]